LAVFGRAGEQRRMAKRGIVTLLTDFGTCDGYVASMKGVLLSRAGDITVVDITHEIPPGDVLAGAFVLRQVLGYFPADTVHAVVVDPGVGTDRGILAAQYAGQTIVAPNNGLISLVDADYGLEGIALVRNEQYFLPSRVGRTFDGRDVIAPVAAALVCGVKLAQLGPPPETYALLELPQPHYSDGALTGQVMHVDRFGNCITNISKALLAEFLPRLAAVTVWAAGVSVGPIRGAFGHVASGQPVAILDSMDRLEVAVNSGRACDALGLRVGDKVKLWYADRHGPTAPPPAEAPAE